MADQSQGPETKTTNDGVVATLLARLDRAVFDLAMQPEPRVGLVDPALITADARQTPPPMAAVPDTRELTARVLALTAHVEQLSADLAVSMKALNDRLTTVERMAAHAVRHSCPNALTCP